MDENTVLRTLRCGFDSCTPYHLAPSSNGKGTALRTLKREFNSHRSRQLGVAQLVEQSPYKRPDAGSIPAAKTAPVVQWQNSALVKRGRLFDSTQVLQIWPRRPMDQGIGLLNRG